MMAAVRPFVVSRDQAARLQAYIQTYRQHALTHLLPSTDRNNTLRLVQAVQGKLVQVLDQRRDTLPLALSPEEREALKNALSELLKIYANQPEGQARLAKLNDLTSLKISLNTECREKGGQCGR